MILDTNAVSALADGSSPLVGVLGRTPRLSVPVIVIGEYAYGIAASRHRSRYEAWLEALLSTSVVLHVDRDTAAQYAAIRGELKSAGRPIPSNDAWIAALARQHALPIASLDRHFDRVEGVHRVFW